MALELRLLDDEELETLRLYWEDRLEQIITEQEGRQAQPAEEEANVA